MNTLENIPESKLAKDATLREHFAGLAMRGVMAGLYSRAAYHGWNSKEIAVEAISASEALLKELEK